MESHGESGTIQITRSTYELVSAEFDCESAGTVQVKGAGDVDVWRVIGRRAGWPAGAGKSGFLGEPRGFAHRSDSC